MYTHILWLLYTIIAALIVIVSTGINIPSEMPTEHQKYLQEEMAKYAKQRQAKRKSAAAKPQEEAPVIPKEDGFSPRKLGMRRSESNSSVPLNAQVVIPSGVYWFGTQMEIAGGKVVPTHSKDGAAPRKKTSVKAFKMDIDCVTNEQFAEFIESTRYRTEAELFHGLSSSTAKSPMLFAKSSTARRVWVV